MMKFNKVALTVSSLLVSSGVFAHGYLTEPLSRDYMCQKGINTQCGNAQYEPQSVGESPKGYPKANLPPEGLLVSGNGPSKYIGVKLNEQTSDRWAKNKMHAGENTFSWHFTAVHATQNWKYYITKQDWDPNMPLTRASFESEPFCQVDGKETVPPVNITHTCQVPERSGYQVIYANWEISNTGNTFYKVIDAEFEDAAPSEWNKSIGYISPKLTLKAGDSVKTRVFGPDERPELSTTLAINSDSEGDINVWSKALATKINAEQPELHAGLKNNKGEVNPVEGMNTLYTRSGSGLTRVEIELDTQQQELPTMTVSGLEKNYTIVNGMAPVSINVTTTGSMVVNAKLFDASQTLVGFGSKLIEDATDRIELEATHMKAGKHRLVVVGITKDQKTLQQSFDIQLNENTGGADYQYTYPDRLKQYAGGTRVLQPKNGKVYECNKGPTSGWCTIYSTGANQYEPGVGGFWQDAWSETGTTR